MLKFENLVTKRVLDIIRSPDKEYSQLRNSQQFEQR